MVEEVQLTRAQKKAAKAEAVMKGRLVWYRELLKQGKPERAADYAARYKLPIEPEPAVDTEQLKEQIRERNRREVEAEFAAMEPKQIQELPPAQPIEFVNGWPVKAQADVYRYPRNQKMVIIQLPDGREAALWNAHGHRLPLGYKVKVKLESASADPYYEVDE